MTECIFCKIVSGEIPAKIITETKDTIAFLDAFPLTHGHTLVIPKKHYQKIQDLSVEQNTDLFNTVHTVIKRVDTISGATLVAVHNGEASGQEIPHVHVHLIPRKSDDGAGPVHNMFPKIPPPTNDEQFEIYDKLKDQL